LISAIALMSTLFTSCIFERRGEGHPHHHSDHEHHDHYDH
jgi:hypothetical protein